MRRTTQPPCSKFLSEDGKTMSYVCYAPIPRKNGEMSYHRRIKRRVLLCVDVKEKNELLKQMKVCISHDPNITVSHLQNLLSCAKAKTLGRMLETINAPTLMEEC